MGYLYLLPDSVKNSLSGSEVWHVGAEQQKQGQEQRDESNKNLMVL